MEKIVIEGKTKLKGEVEISGAKNAAVAILPAMILVNGVCILENVPNISDIKMSCQILKALGVKIRKISENTLEIDSRNIESIEAPLDLTSKFRASYYLTGALLGRCGHAVVGMPRRMQTRSKTNGPTHKSLRSIRRKRRSRARKNRSKSKKTKRKLNLPRHSISRSNHKRNACFCLSRTA